jgi:hypothetical protein
VNDHFVFHVAEAAEFKEQYEASMRENKPLLSGTGAQATASAASNEKKEGASAAGTGTASGAEAVADKGKVDDTAESKAADELAGKIAAVAVSETPVHPE